MASASVELLLRGMVESNMDYVRQSPSPNIVLHSPMLPDAVEGPDAVVAIITPSAA